MAGVLRGHVWIACESAVLSGGIAGALSALGWRIAAPFSDVAEPAAPDGQATMRRMVLVADEQGRLPAIPPTFARQVNRLVVVVGALNALERLAAAVAIGATAAIAGDQPLPHLAAAVDRVLVAGGSGAGQDPQRPRARLLASLRAREEEACRFASLTAREQEVLAALIAGHSAAQMAADNHLALATVRSQIRGILTKLGVTSQLAAVALAHRSCREPTVESHLRRLHQF